MFLSPTLLLLCGLGGGYAAPQLGPTQLPPPPDPANTAPKAEGDYSDGCYYVESQQRWICGPANPTTQPPTTTTNPSCDTPEGKYLCRVSRKLLRGPGQKCYWDKYEEIWKCGPASPPDNPDPDGCMDNPYLCRKKRLRQDHTRNVDGLRSNSWALLGKTLEEAEEIVNDKGIIHLGWKSSHLTA